MLCTVFCYRQERFLTFLKLCGISLSTIALTCQIHLSWHRIEQVSLSLLSFPLWHVSFFITLVFFGVSFCKKAQICPHCKYCGLSSFLQVWKQDYFLTIDVFIVYSSWLSSHLFDFYSMVSFKLIHPSIHLKDRNIAIPFWLWLQKFFLGLESRLLGYL